MTAQNQVLKIIGLAGMYFGAAWSASFLGLWDGFRLPIYPAAGVALGALICCGTRLWPGIFIGAFAFNYGFINYVIPSADLSVAPILSFSVGMAVAAVAQALVGAFIFKRLVSSINPLNRIKDALIFIFPVTAGGCAICCVICNLVCSWTMDLSGHPALELFFYKGITRWLGDIMGVLLVAPLFFVFRQPLNFRWTSARRFEAIILLFLFYITSQVVFGDWLQYSHYPLVYLLAPCLVWAAYRFGHPGTIIAILMVTAIAIWGTMEGRGPFTLGSLEESFALLQSYLLVLTVMTLTLSAAVTEAEKAQTQSTRFGRVLDDSYNEIYLFDAETLKFIQVNRGARENLGYTLEELQSMTPLDLKPDFTPQELQDSLKPLRNKTSNIVTFRARHRRKDGTFYPVEARVQLSHAEIFPVFVAVVQDITEKQRVEEELAIHRNQLEGLVRQRTADLESTHLQLLHAEKLAATGKMAASMAHEFNNPIFGIRNVLEKILRRVQMEDNNKRFVKLAIQECDRVTALIRKVLDFHSPSTDEKELIDVHEAIDDIILMIQKKFSVRNIRLIKNYAEDMPLIEAVPDQFMQVILNVLQNAEEAIPEGGGKITITTASMNGDAQIQIKDTGMGIPDHLIKNIFDPFFTTKPSVKGTGLGLSVSYGIIKKHRGKILVDSLPDCGTTFTISLPIRQENSVAIPG